MTRCWWTRRGACRITNRSCAALAKLVNVNEPDLVLFVGEALVGNDSVDQLSKFNQRLSDLSSRAEKTKLIDGIVLSFDTVDG